MEQYSHSQEELQPHRTPTNFVLSVLLEQELQQTYTSTTTKDWYVDQTLGLTNSTVYWKSIAEKPGTSLYASERSAKNDELHVVVVDDTGAVTGTAGNIVEKFTFLTKSDGITSPTEAVYYKNLLARISEYVYAGAAPTGVAGGLTAGTGNAFTATGTETWGTPAQGRHSLSAEQTYLQPDRW